jgi:hypothetical protein
MSVCHELRNADNSKMQSKVPTGLGKLEEVREFDWSGKVREKQKFDIKLGNQGK